MENWRKFTENIDVDVDVGDVILGGKYKNKRMVVKEIGKDELGQPTVNGKPMLKFRIEKHLPDNKKSKKTLDAEKEEKEKLDEAFLNPKSQGYFDALDGKERDSTMLDNKEYLEGYEKGLEEKGK